MTLVGQLNIPKQSPMMTGDARITLDLPSYDIRGDVNTNVKIPKSTGSIFNTTSNLNFILNESKMEIDGVFSTKMLNIINFEGNINYLRNYSDGQLINHRGNLNGNIYHGINYNWQTQGTGWAIDCILNLEFGANCNTQFNENGLHSLLFEGNIISNGFLNVELLGCSISPSYTIEADAKLEKQQELWKIKSDLIFNYKLSEDGIDRTYNYNLEHTFN